MAPDYLTPDEVASQLQVSRQVVYNWINDGRLRAVKAGRTLRIPHYALDAFLQPVHVGDISTDDIEPEGALRFDRFTAAAQALAEAAVSEARRRGHVQLEVEHQLWALLQPADGILQQALQRLGVDPHQVEGQVDQVLAKLPSDPTFQPSGSMMAISPGVAQVLQRSEELANMRPDLQIDASHILQAICMDEDSASAQILHSFGVTPERVGGVLLEIRVTQPAAAPQTGRPRGADWEQRIERQLTRIETELTGIRALLSQSSRDLH